MWETSATLIALSTGLSAKHKEIICCRKTGIILNSTGQHLINDNSIISQKEFMKQTFTKTIQGHQLEFTRQTDTAAYIVLPKNIEHKELLFLHRDERGMWNVKEIKHLPAWYNEISLYVHIAIEENELDENEIKEKKGSVFNDFEYLF